MCLSVICGLHQASQKNSFLQFIPVNYNAAFRHINDVFDRAVLVWQLRTESQRREAMDQLSREVQARIDNAGTVHRISHLEELFLGIMIPSLAKSYVLQTANRVDRDLALTALALRQARGRDGTFPATSRICISPDSNCHRIASTKGRWGIFADRGLLLYSVGADLEDNGGQPRSDAGVQKTWDMVVIADR